MTHKIGVTGGIGSGKSTVCEILRTFGARIFNADVEAKAIMTNNLQVRQEIIDAFGVDSYKSSGGLDTVFLANEIFSDPEKVKTINQLVHPRVLDAFAHTVQMARKDGVNMVVMEAALLFESGADQGLDLVVVVDASRHHRVNRVSTRDGTSEHDVTARMRHQLPAEEFLRRADVVIRNDGTYEDLQNRVARFVRQLMAGEIQSRQKPEPLD